MPELRKLLMGDDPQGWESAGFEVIDNTTTIGNIDLEFVEESEGGFVGWELTDIEDGPIDGLRSTRTTADPSEPIKHPNGVSRMDHVVVMTPDIARTVGAFEQAGFDARRTRDIPGSEPARQQVFLWAGETILEVVGPVEPIGEGPASIWGLALTTDDMAGAVALLGEGIGTPKTAVQPGREIATIRTKDLGVSLALAVMTPHVDPETVGPSHA